MSFALHARILKRLDTDVPITETTSFSQNNLKFSSNYIFYGKVRSIVPNRYIFFQMMIFINLFFNKETFWVFEYLKLN